MISFAKARCGSVTSWRGGEPTIAELLSDSIVVAMMQADGVDPRALEAQLRGMAQAGPWPLPD